MFPKQSTIPKKGFGSTLSFNNAIAYSFSSREDFRIHQRPSPTSGNKNMSPPTYRTYSREGLRDKNARISELMREIEDAKEVLNENKREILKELPAFQNSIKQEVQTMMLFFIDNLKNFQGDYSRELQISIDALRSQISEKEIVNQNLLEVNKSLAQKNETLSKLLFNTTNQLNKAQSREQSLEDSRDYSMGYTKKFSEKLFHESKTISKHFRKPQDLTAYSSAKIKSTVKPAKEITKLSTDRSKSRIKLYESQRTLATESDRGGYSSTDNLESPLGGRRMNLNTGEASFVYVESEDAETNAMKSSVEQLIEDAQNYRRIALEENQKYLEAVQALEEAAKEKNFFVEIQDKYNKLLDENDQLIVQTHLMLKQFNDMMSNRQIKVFDNNGNEDFSAQSEIERLRKLNSDFEENYMRSTLSLNRKIELIMLEKEQVEKLLSNTKMDLEVAIKNHKKAVQTISSLTSDLGKGENQLDISAQNQNIQALQAELERTKQELENYANKESSILSSGRNNGEIFDNEKELLKKEIEKLSKELEESKSKLKVYDETYNGHLEMINDLHSKIESLFEEFEQFRNVEDKDNITSKHIVGHKERESVESVGEVFTKLDGLEKTLHWYLEERKKLIDENNELKTNLNEAIEARISLEQNQSSQFILEPKLTTPNNETEFNIEYETKIEQLNTELNEAKQSKQNVENELNSLQKLKEELETEIKDYKFKLSDIEVKMLELDAMNINLKESNQSLEANTMMLSKEKQDLLKKVKESNDKIEELSNTIKDLKLEIEERQKNYDEVQEKLLNQTGKTNEADQIEINSLRSKIEDFEKQIEEYKNEKEILEKLSKIEREKTEELEKHIEDLKVEFESKIQEYENIMSEYRDNNQNQQDSKEDMIEKYEKLQSVCDKFEMQCEQLTRDKEELEMDLRIAQNENEELQKNLEQMALKYNVNEADLGSEDEPDIM